MNRRSFFAKLMSTAAGLLGVGAGYKLTHGIAPGTILETYGLKYMSGPQPGKITGVTWLRKPVAVKQSRNVVYKLSATMDPKARAKLAIFKSQVQAAIKYLRENHPA